MENLTNQVLKLNGGRNFFVIRQASYRGETYYFTVEVNEEMDDFKNTFKFLQRKNVNGEFHITEVTDENIIKILAQNIKLETE